MRGGATDSSVAARPPVRTAGAVLGCAAVLALAGAVLAIGELTSGGHAVPRLVLDEEPFAGAWDEPASFGRVTVQQIERSAAGSHGHAGRAAEVDELAVSVMVANTRGRPVPFSPGQFRLRLRNGTTVTALRPNPPPGSVGARATLRQRVAFLVPSRPLAPALVFDDLGSTRPLRLELGPVGRAPGRTGGP